MNIMKREISSDTSVNILSLREALLLNGFWTAYRIEQLICLISQDIEVMKQEYDLSRHEITLKIKKTNTRKIADFHHDPTWYFNPISNAVSYILQCNKDDVINCLAIYFNIAKVSSSREIHDMYNGIICMPLYNLFNVQCISDNILQIIL